MAVFDAHGRGQGAGSRPSQRSRSGPVLRHVRAVSSPHPRGHFFPSEHRAARRPNQERGEKQNRKHANQPCFRTCVFNCWPSENFQRPGEEPPSPPSPPGPSPPRLPLRERSGLPSPERRSPPEPLLRCCHGSIRAACAVAVTGASFSFSGRMSWTPPRPPEVGFPATPAVDRGGRRPAPRDGVLRRRRCDTSNTSQSEVFEPSDSIQFHNPCRER